MLRLNVIRRFPRRGIRVWAPAEFVFRSNQKTSEAKE